MFARFPLEELPSAVFPSLLATLRDPLPLPASCHAAFPAQAPEKRAAGRSASGTDGLDRTDARDRPSTTVDVLVPCGGSATSRDNSSQTRRCAPAENFTSHEAPGGNGGAVCVWAGDLLTHVLGALLCAVREAVGVFP